MNDLNLKPKESSCWNILLLAKIILLYDTGNGRNINHTLTVWANGIISSCIKWITYDGIFRNGINIITSYYLNCGASFFKKWTIQQELFSKHV